MCLCNNVSPTWRMRGVPSKRAKCRARHEDLVVGISDRVIFEYLSALPKGDGVLADGNADGEAQARPPSTPAWRLNAPDCGCRMPKSV